MTKSITNALVGILIGRGEFSVDNLAPISEWKSPGDPRSKITISHLLRMNALLDEFLVPGERALNVVAV